MEVGEFVVAGVTDLLFSQVKVKGSGDEYGFGEGLIEPDLFHIAGIFHADVGDTEEPAHLGGVDGAVTEGHIRPEAEQHPEHAEIKPEKSPDFSCCAFIRLSEGDEFDAIGL